MWLNSFNPKIPQLCLVGLFSVLASISVLAKTHSDFSPADLQIFAQSQQWQYLLHMRSSSFSKKRSRIKATAPYFISPDGWRDPLEELKASLQTFQDPQKFIETRGQHPDCLFPARLRVLKQSFNLDVKPVECPALEQWKRILHHDDVVLTFASQYLSSPSSMMGHTFLKFKNSAQQDFMNSTISYAASVPENINAFQYAERGLFGGFIGRFSRQPYYEKVHEYNNMEQRDLWEFAIKLNSYQRELLLEHLWELQNLAEFDYYFIDENCAFMMLAAIQVTIPERSILDHFPIYALPAETAKNLDRADLIKEVIYRPSLSKKLRHKYSLISSVEQEKVLNSISQKSVDDLQSPTSLETLLEKISLERHRHNGELNPELLELEKKTLIKRASLGPIEAPEVPEPESPLKSHFPMHIELGGGQSSLDQGYSLLTLRPSIHKLTDKDAGYLKNSSFNLMELELISPMGIREMKFHRLVVAEVGISQPYLPIDPAISWQVKLGHQRETNSLCPGCMLSFFEGGAGATFRTFNESFDLIPMLSTLIQLGPEIPRGRVWMGPKVDLIFTFDNKWKWRQTFFYGKDLRADQDITEMTILTDLRFFDFQPHWDLAVIGLSHLHSANVPQDISLRLIHDF